MSVFVDFINLKKEIKRLSHLMAFSKEKHLIIQKIKLMINKIED